MADWHAIKTEYITTDISYRKLAEKYGINYKVIADRGKSEKWGKLRSQYRDKTLTTTIDKISKKEAKRCERLMSAADRLLAKVERAIEELDITLATDVTKTKSIEYNNDLRPDKPTKEIVEEKTEIRQVVTIIDRSGLKAISSALRDIKEVQMLKTALDTQEQKAKIANLERTAGMAEPDIEDNSFVSAELFPDEAQNT